MKSEQQYWIVKRYVVETYEVLAETREEAIEEAVSPYSVDVRNITCVKSK